MSYETGLGGRRWLLPPGKCLGPRFWCAVGKNNSEMHVHLPPPLAFSFFTSLPMKAAIPRLENSARC